MRNHDAAGHVLALATIFLFSIACHQNAVHTYGANTSSRLEVKHAQPQAAALPPTLKRVVDAGLEQTKYTFYYDQGYSKINYPGGDVPLERGACTDIIIRAFRKVGVDLQKEVHEDMQRHFAVYPKTWGLKGPDTNIDHRRVPNLRTYFERKGRALPVTDKPEDYLPGDVVTWDVNGYPHIAMVTNVWSDEARHYLLVHNMGRGAKVEDILFAWPITGHYRYF
ncbi:MAG TPA: DUF1287 domain-containing protein [Pyrinomonadaceae bacterium]|nr:DUF1287 domain-containing protein [Pyrinomonadaceae bacterium]